MDISNYITSTGNVFVLKNLPEVVKGALFSRYSRSEYGIRELLEKEFNTDFVEKAESFYDRILDDYGDDSIGELGGAHIAFEGISVLAAKFLEDLRIGGSPLEKSTRYVRFEKSSGKYPFYRDNYLLAYSGYEELCNFLFYTYSSLYGDVFNLLKKRYPGEGSRYNVSVKAETLDLLRGLLPASTLTNVGIFGNGRFYEHLLKKLMFSSFEEFNLLGKKAKKELDQVIPSFVRKGDPNHKYTVEENKFKEKTNRKLLELVNGISSKERETFGVKLIDYTKDGEVKICVAEVFEKTNCSLQELHRLFKTSEKLTNQVLDAISEYRTNRRHKSPRSLEHVTFTFEIVADYGIYRDLQRHRMLTQGKQILNCNMGYEVPKELQGTPYEKKYVVAMEKAKEFCKGIDNKNLLQYAVPMGYRTRWYFHITLRELQWLCEIRSMSQGHFGYRSIAIDMAKEVVKAYPSFKRFLKFVDYNDYILGRNV